MPKIKIKYTKALKEAINTRHRYKCEESSPPDDYLFIEDDYKGKAFYVDEYSATDQINYSQFVLDLPQTVGHHLNNPTLPLSECKKLVDNLLKDNSAKSIADFKHSFFVCSKDDLPEFLKYAFENVFFSKYKNGKIIYVRLDSTMYSRSGFIRANYSLINYPEIKEELDKTKSFKGFNVLNKWMIFENHEYFSTFLNIAEYFFFPYIMSYHSTWMLGLYFIFIPDDPIKYVPEAFPRDMLDFIRRNSEIAKNSIDSEDVSSIYSKYCFDVPPSQDEYVVFIKWYLSKSERFIYDSLNICNYLDNKGEVDPIYALEHNISILHILKISLSIFASNNSYYNKSIAFQVADMFDAICNNKDIGINIGDTNFFKELFNKNYFSNKLLPILNDMKIDSAFKTKLIDIFSSLYKEITETMKQSIWLEYKITGNNVNVKKKDLINYKVESIEEFTSNALRTLRNTHHGYITRYDIKASRPSRYLSMITGELPSTLPSLIFIWILCLLENKEKFIGKQ